MPAPASARAQKTIAAAKNVYAQRAGQKTPVLQREIDAAIWRHFGVAPKNPLTATGAE